MRLENKKEARPASTALISFQSSARTPWLLLHRKAEKPLFFF